MSIDPQVTERVAQARAENVARKAALGPGAAMAAVQTLEVPVPERDATVRVRLLVPTAAPDTVLVYLHGGGWVMGSIDTFDRLGRELARRTDAVVVMVDYAKAPEHRYPAAVQDAVAAYRWTVAHAADVLAGLGTPLASDPRFFVGGDSAGANLSAVVARHAVAEGFRLDGQVLAYPVTDCDLTRPSYDTIEGGRDGMRQFWELYCDPERRTEPDASPLLAETLRGQPPALVLNAEHDVLNDEVDAYAQRLADEGVPVTRHLLAGAPHGILTYFDSSDAADQGLDAVVAWIRG